MARPGSGDSYRGRSERSRALVGARLGFQATADLLALATAIARAVAGANLTLILLDMKQACSPGDQLGVETAVDMRPPTLQPSAPSGP